MSDTHRNGCPWPALVLAVALIANLACSSPTPPTPGGVTVAPGFDPEQALATLAPVHLTWDPATLDENQTRALSLLIQAAGHIDEIFWRQVWAGNEDLRRRLQPPADAPPDPLVEYFRVNYGPFDRLNDFAPFIGDTPRPPGAAYYPDDLTREEFETWLQTHPEDEPAFRSAFTLIRRDGDRLVAVPYHQAYRDRLEPAADLLRQAAALTTSPSLRRYLELRARDLLTDDFFDSDMAWMDVTDTPIEVVIGPYEVYEDGLMGYKAAYEAFVTIRNPAESRKLEAYVGFLDDMERHLPIPDSHRNFNRGSESPILVVDAVFTAGDTHAGIQTSAFNLPNDERVREAKGSKKVMLKNVMQAKFEQSLARIADRVLDPAIREHLDFQAYFDHVVLHEISHGLGPGKLILDGRETSVNAELRDLYAPIEECKADIAGVWNTLWLMERGVLPRREKEQFTTYLAGMFRSVRFGMTSAHGRGTVAQYNYLKEKGALTHDPATGRYGVDFDRMPDAIRDLTHEVLMLQAQPDYQRVQAWLDRYGRVPTEIQATLATLGDIPVDIRPIYQLPAGL